MSLLEDRDLADWKQFSFFEPSERKATELTVNLPEGHPNAPKKVRPAPEKPLLFWARTPRGTASLAPSRRARSPPD